MNVMNCKSCGRLFNVMANEKICPACKQALEDKFQEVKRYLEENPNSSVEQVANENDVSVKQIKQWVREERLIFSEGSLQGIECESCGKMIRTGRFCDECKANMTNTLKNALDRPKAPEPKRPVRDGDRMRFLQSGMKD